MNPPDEDRDAKSDVKPDAKPNIKSEVEENSRLNKPDPYEEGDLPDTDFELSTELTDVYCFQRRIL